MLNIYKTRAATSYSRFLNHYKSCITVHLNYRTAALCNRSLRSAPSSLTSSRVLYQSSIAFLGLNSASGGDKWIIQSRSCRAGFFSLFWNLVFTHFITLKPRSASSRGASYQVNQCQHVACQVSKLPVDSLPGDSVLIVTMSAVTEDLQHDPFWCNWLHINADRIKYICEVTNQCSYMLIPETSCIM